jgi:hypothetical protein
MIRVVLGLDVCVPEAEVARWVMRKIVQQIAGL